MLYPNRYRVWAVGGDGSSELCYVQIVYIFHFCRTLGVNDWFLHRERVGNLGGVGVIQYNEVYLFMVKITLKRLRRREGGWF
jgi:hypothetical protein